METLFNKYAEAWNAYNPEAIANLYRLPCAISDADGVETYTDKSSLIKKFAKNCEDMKDHGFKKASFNVLSLQELMSEQVAVTLGWRIETASQAIEFRSLYIMVRN